MVCWHIESLGVDYWNERQSKYDEENNVLNIGDRLDEIHTEVLRKRIVSRYY